LAVSRAHFLVRNEDARAIIYGQVAGIMPDGQAVCNEADVSPAGRALLWRRQFLNTYAFEGYAGGLPEGLYALAFPEHRV